MESIASGFDFLEHLSNEVTAMLSSILFFLDLEKVISKENVGPAALLASVIFGVLVIVVVKCCKRYGKTSPSN